ncbi:MAG: nucleotidyltransferase family protein, partial [Pseudomonadota bacterium]
QLSRFSAEQYCVILCLANDRAAAQELLTHQFDYEAMATFMLMHEVSGEISAFAKSHDLHLPEELSVALSERQDRVAARCDEILDATISVSDVLKRRNHSFFCAKGAVWDIILRDQRGTRSIKDIDFYVRKDDLSSAVQAIEDAFDCVKFESIETAFKENNAASVWISDFDVKVEVHWSLVSRSQSENFDLDIAFSNIVEIETPRGSIASLNPSQVINFCAVELGKDSWDSLKKLVDFATAIERAEDEDLEDAVRAAKSAGGLRILRISVIVAHELGLLPQLPATKEHWDKDYVAILLANACLNRLAVGRAPLWTLRGMREALITPLKHDNLSSSLHQFWQGLVRRLPM